MGLKKGRVSASRPLSQTWLAVVAILIVSLGGIAAVTALGSSFIVRTTVLISMAGTLVGLLLWQFERSQRIAEQWGLSRSEERFRSLVQNTADIIAVLDADGTVRYVSSSAERVLGYKAEEIVGKNIGDFLLPAGDAKAPWLLAAAFEDPGETVKAEARGIRPGGAEGGPPLYLEVVSNNQFSNPSIGGILLTARDITERKALEDQLIHQAFHDSLTGLPNRALFMDRLSHALARARRRFDDFAVLYLDLDDFKVVNDSLGHVAGDQLLVMVARRLQGCMRSEDTIARLGGDEFTILVERITNPNGATAMAQRLQEELRAPFTIEGHDVVVTTSTGIALCTSTLDRPGDLIRNADIAMYEAKSRCKGCYAVFEPSMNLRASRRLEMDIDLRKALEHGDFRVHYQPIVQLETGAVVAVEALVRWNHPQRGLISPADFIPVAEQTGLIGPIGQRVLEEACRQVRAFNALHPNGPPLRLSVNLSPRQFQDAGLVKGIARVLKETEFDPRYLSLEITESVALDNTEATVATFAELKALGIHMVIDDFGMGHSAWSYLTRYPIDALKIDRAFIDGVGHDPEDTAIVRAVIEVARALNLKVTAEGIENAEQLVQLREMQCDYGQGFHLSRPLPAMMALDSMFHSVRQPEASLDSTA